MMAKKKKLRKLTTKLRLWGDYYMANGWNGTLAAKQAGYNAKSETAFRVIGSENLARLNVQAYISERMSEAGMKADEVIARIAAMARGFDVADYFEQVPVYGLDADKKQYLKGHDLVFDFDKLQKDGYSHLIKGMKVTPNGIIPVWHDAKAALDTLTKVHGLVVDKFQGEIDVKQISSAAAIQAIQQADKELKG